MKIAAFAFFILASFNVSATGNNNVSSQQFMDQLLKQVKSVATESTTQGHNGGSCKPQGAQCSQHGECCSNFCGRGEC